MRRIGHKGRQKTVPGKWTETSAAIAEKKLDRIKEIGMYVLLAVLTAFFCWLFCTRRGIFGSKVDWISQHSVLPDYFRQQFYDTGKLFPEFAANIGGGQNIYHFSYYGLYSPAVLLSYLLPFVKMSDYMMAVQFVGLTASVLLLYTWLRKCGGSREISFGVSVMFLLSGPMIYQSYNQIMFVSYMPFLCMGFLGVERYFANGSHCGRKGGSGKRQGMLLTVSIFLMIMSSFYFSIGGMAALALYGIYRYLMCRKAEDRFAVCLPGKQGQIVSWVQRGRNTVSQFLKEGVHFSIPFFAAVLMSGVLLVPTACALTGRAAKGVQVSLLSLLIPDLNMERLCYSAYGVGLTAFSLAAVLYLLFKERNFLAGACLVLVGVPFFSYLLNGGLYIRDKVMIPFLPLFCYLTACYLESMKRKSISWKDGLPYFAVLMAGVLCVVKKSVSHGKVFLIDGTVMLFCFFMILLWKWWMKRKKKRILLYSKGNSFCVCILLACVILLQAGGGAVEHSRENKMLDREFYEEVTDEKVKNIISEIEESKSGFYRMEQLGTEEENAANLNRIWNSRQMVSSIYSSSYNADYLQFRRQVFQLEQPFRNYLMQPAAYNPIYQDFMGVKYLISKKNIAGYELYRKTNEWNVYKNEDALPIAYTTERLMPEAEYRKLEFPYNQTALLDYAVVEKADGETAAAYIRGMGKQLQPTEDIFEEAADEAAAVSEGTELEKASDLERNHTSKKWITKAASGYQIDLKKNYSLKINLPKREAEEKRILFLQFDVKNLHPSKDVAVWLEGIRNKLTAEEHFYYNENTTFTYAVMLKDEQTQAEMCFGAGSYEITDIRCVLLNTENAEAEKLSQAEFVPDKIRTKGNVIAGEADVKKKGFFITTIPYETNFEIFVDGEQVEYEKVNTAFLGFPITKGTHKIEIIYHAPGLAVGKIISISGMVLFVIYCRRQRHTGRGCCK